MKLLYEYEHVIHVDAKTELKKYTIRQALLDAMQTRRYAKFYAGKYYIGVTFNRDHTVQFSTNYTFDFNFNKELRRLETKKFTLNTTTYFVWYWINKFRKIQ